MAAREGLTDAERFPLMSKQGQAMLDRLRQHPSAPVYNLRCGDRLTREKLEAVRRYEAALVSNEPAWQFRELPDWVIEYTDRCLRDVPIYRNGGGAANSFFDLPTVTRADLAREPWSFVPDARSLEDLMVYYTSGTTGKPLNVLSHPETASMRLPLFRKALRARGADVLGGRGRVAIAFICAQLSTLTYATISEFLGEAGVVKVNLNPAEWRDPDDRIRFLEDLDAEIYTGDPLSFMALADLPVKVSPRGMISSAMRLLPAVRQELEKRFQCPVADIYSTCESGPIAHAVEGGYAILPNDLYVEALDDEGRPVAPGEIGEITLTGGRNPFLPLLRYRTGDWASISYAGATPLLQNLEGRAPVVFRATDGRLLNNIDVATVLRPIPLAQFVLHQNADGSLLLRTRGGLHAERQAREALLQLFGQDQTVEVGTIPDDQWKVVPYSTDLCP